MALIIGADLETTGLDPADHRIIEIYAGLWNLETRELVHDHNQRIHPQRSILPAAQAVHGISISDLERCPTFEAAAPTCREVMERGDLVVGHNWDGFDAPFINAELVRVKQSKLTKPTFDTMLNGRWATPNGSVPNLGALCWACEVEYDVTAKHSGKRDVSVMMECFFKGLDWGWFKVKGINA